MHSLSGNFKYLVCSYITYSIEFNLRTATKKSEK